MELTDLPDQMNLYRVLDRAAVLRVVTPDMAAAKARVRKEISNLSRDAGRRNCKGLHRVNIGSYAGARRPPGYRAFSFAFSQYSPACRDASREVFSNPLFGIGGLPWKLCAKPPFHFHSPSTGW